MSVKVAVRSRPLSAEERQVTSDVVIRMNGARVQVVDAIENHSFLYDAALWSSNVLVEGSDNEHASQETVYKAVGTDILTHILTGYNGCIFAYGQTGSGKTYSMMGMENDEGIIPRIAKNLFVESRNLNINGVEAFVEVSYYEIYNEKVRCLLRPTDGGFEDSQLRVREHPKYGPFIEGLAKFVVTNEEEFLALMNDGNKVRTTGSTAMNATSSRSHAVFCVTLTQKRRNGLLITTKTSRLNLVDLAGSERANKTLATGKRLTEGVNINKSLTCLGNVISALAEEQEMGKPRHIPYRDSVLTWILKDNLGGNSKTVMLATISPSQAQLDETLSTLRYAERAKKIVNKAVVNESNNNEVIAALQKEIEALRLQLKDASAVDREKIFDELAATEAIKKELNASMEEKLAETKRMMEEREEYMKHLESQLASQKTEIETLRESNAEKERQIASLMKQIAEQESGAPNANKSEKVEQLREMVAILEQEQNSVPAAPRGPSEGSVGRSAGDTAVIRAEDLGQVKPQAGGKVSVRSLVKAFEQLSTAPEPVQTRPVYRYHDAQEIGMPKQEVANGATPAALSLLAAAAAPAPQVTCEKTAQDSFNADDLLEMLGEDSEELKEVHQDASAADHAADDELEIDDEELELDDDELELDDDDDEVPPPPPLPEDEGATGGEWENGEDLAEEELELDDAEYADGDYAEADGEAAVQEEGETGAEAEEAGAEPQWEGAAEAGAEAEGEGEPEWEGEGEAELEWEAAPLAEPASETEAVNEKHGGGTSAVAAPLTANDVFENGEANQLAARDAQATAVAAGDIEKGSAMERGAAAAAPTERPGVVPPSPTITTLVVPSHALPNNRYLREPFKVIKVNDSALIGSKKERIWDIDFFGKRFANLDMAGYMSFEQPSSNLFRVEKDIINSRRLTLYFFEAPHPYELEFTSTVRRQRFFELAMLLRRNSIMWCPSLCMEGENDIILQVQGTTIERPNSKVIKATGDTKFMIARMPYEVIDFWYGCFSMQGRSLPQSAAVLGSFLPKDSHEVYIIGVMDVPNSLINVDDLGRYFLNYLGSALYFVLANTALETKKRQTNNAIVIIVRRSFIVRVSHIEAMEVPPVSKEGLTKGDFTAVGCAVRVNEASIGVLLINARENEANDSSRASCIRMLMSSFPFADPSIDIAYRFDYLIVSGSFGFGGDFTEEDMLLKQIKAANLLSNFEEAEPHTSLKSAPSPIRIFYIARQRVSRMDVKKYASSRALAVPNAFIAADVFCQRAFLSVFGEQVSRVQFILDKISVTGHRLPNILNPELQISADWIERSPLLMPLTKCGEGYVVSGHTIPAVNTVVSNYEFLRLQTITFSVVGNLQGSKEKRKFPLASGVLPLKGSFTLGKEEKMNVPLSYRACTVGTLSGTILQVFHEKNDSDLAALGLHGARDAFVVSCYENQVHAGKGQWAPSSYEENRVYPFSKRDTCVSCTRESYKLPNPEKWKWLNQWSHETRPDAPDGWTYAESFEHPFLPKKTKVTNVRRRRWTRVMQAADALALHQYIIQINSVQRQ